MASVSPRPRRRRKWPALKPANVGKHIDAVHAVDVHVADAVVDVVAARAHLVEAGGVEAPLGLRPRHDRVQADDAGLVAAIHPAVHAVVVLHDPRCVIDVLGGQAAVEHVGRLDHVVIDAHQDKIVNIHDSLLSCSTYDRLCTIGQRSCPIGRTRRGRILGWIDLRDGGRATCGSLVYEGERLTTGYHHHDLHQIEYAVHGVVEVETSDGTYLLPPHQAAWIPAGCTHQATLHAAVTTISVLFDPSLVPAAGDRVRILTASPLIREMVMHAVRWPITRRETDPAADDFFRTLGPPRRRRAAPRVGPRSAHLRRSGRGRGDRLHPATPGDGHARGRRARRSAYRSGPSVGVSWRGSTCHGGRTSRRRGSCGAWRCSPSRVARSSTCRSRSASTT